MRKKSRKFLQALLQAPSPSGYEGPVRQVWKEEVAAYADEVSTDVHGNAIAACNKEGKPRIMLAGHMDELGLQIVHIDDEGFIYFDTIGGFDLSTISGRKVRIHTRKGPILGVIGKKPIHLMSSSEREKVPEKHQMWIDIGVKNGTEAGKLVEVGDPVTYDANFEMLRGDLVVSRGLDNKMGAFLAAETMRCISEEDKKAKAALYAVATVQEEVGLRGAITSTYGIDPEVGIALDVTWSMDHPNVDKRKAGGAVIGGGPVIARGANINPVVFDLLVRCAKDNGIPYQIQAESGGTGTDANAMQLSRSGVATGLIGVPQRYMHTPVEVLSLKDLDNTVRLLVRFVRALDEETSFIP